MKNTVALVLMIGLIGLLAACSGAMPHHKAPMPDPASFQAHFPDMDANGDDRVDWTEFKNHFDQATPEAYQALDMNKDGGIDHDEWHQFKEAHGLKDH